MAFQRLIAVLILVIPGVAGTYGWILMKETIIDSMGPEIAFSWLRFLLGLILFLFGVAFIGGWMFFRDRKRNYVQPKFREKRKKTN
jgi:hypothetical protein